VLTVHDLVPLLLPDTVSTAFRWQFRLWLARSLQVAAHVVCVSEVTRQSVLAHFDVDPAKLTVVHHGVDHVEAVARADATTENWLDALGLGEAFVLYAGALDARKNVELVFAAMERLHQGGRRVPLVLAGQRWFGGDSIERAMQRTKRAGVSVRALGYLADPVFYALMRRATAFVFPSRYEGFGLPPLEAMRLGVPTIVSTEGSLPETCGAGAWQVGPDDAQGLADQLERLLASAPLREERINAGLQWSRRFTWADAVAKTRAVYDAVAP
ncbi:MAG: glycosyltransferase family 4 protein, partial [Archangium sp.]|nr:glycosyltransferase family 4 protein [Archangium sp.]